MPGDCRGWFDDEAEDCRERLYPFAIKIVELDESDIAALRTDDQILTALGEAWEQVRKRIAKLARCLSRTEAALLAVDIDKRASKCVAPTVANVSRHTAGRGEIRHWHFSIRCYPPPRGGGDNG